MSVEDDVLQALKVLEGKAVWCMGVSLPTGADFLLKAGERWHVPDPLSKKEYTEHGEAQLYASCSWQLQDENGEIVLSSAEIWATGDKWAEDLEDLEGHSIRAVQVANGAREMALTFDDLRKLTVRADLTELEDKHSGPSCIISSGTSDRFVIGGSKPIEVMPRFTAEELAGLERVE